MAERMGSSAFGPALRMLASATLVLTWAGAGLAQAPVFGGLAPASEALPPAPERPVPAGEPTSPSPSPLVQPAPERAAPPNAVVVRRSAPPHTATPSPAPPAPLRAEQVNEPPPSTAKADTLLRSSPWVDFTLTSFQLDERASNFLNFGVQVGGYMFQRWRFSARLVAPLEAVADDHRSYGVSSQEGTSQFTQVEARRMSLLYAVTAGLLVTNSKTFAFAPGVELQRTDVDAYGTTLALGLPFEWTTTGNLRVGFELAVGRAFGGSVKEVCRTLTTPAVACASRESERPAGTALLIQYSMGWALGRL